MAQRTAFKSGGVLIADLLEYNVGLIILAGQSKQNALHREDLPRKATPHPGPHPRRAACPARRNHAPKAPKFHFHRDGEWPVAFATGLWCGAISKGRNNRPISYEALLRNRVKKE